MINMKWNNDILLEIAYSNHLNKQKINTSLNLCLFTQIQQHEDFCNKETCFKVDHDNNGFREVMVHYSFSLRISLANVNKSSLIYDLVLIYLENL